MNKLDPEEKEILETYEKDEWQTVSNILWEIERYHEYAPFCNMDQFLCRLHPMSWQQNSSTDGYPSILAPCPHRHHFRRYHPSA